MSNKFQILELINDMEILLKQDKRFHLSNDHKYKDKIKALGKSDSFNGKSIDITPLINLAKLQTKQPVIIDTKEIVETDNSESLKNIITRLSELNKKMDNIVN
jgi:hypothetical protein